MKKLILILAITWSFTGNVSASEYKPCTSAETNAGTCFSCGASCAARYAEQTEQDGTTKGVLTVSGQGSMNNYSTSYNETLGRGQTTAPWKDLDRSIQKVIIEDGITKIGSGAFYHVKTQEISIPNTVTQINKQALQYSALKELNIPNSVTIIENGALNGITTLQNLTLPSSLTSIGNMALGNTYFNNLTIEGNVVLTEDMLKDGTRIPALSSIQNIYCEMTNQSCLNLLKGSQPSSKIKLYEKKSGAYFYDGKFYQSPTDISKNNYTKKRIYTIDEVNTVSGKKNTFKIRYK